MADDTNDTTKEKTELLRLEAEQQAQKARAALGDAVEQVQLAAQAEREKRTPYVKPTVTPLNPGILVTWNNGERAARFPNEEVATREGLRQRNGLESIQLWLGYEYGQPEARPFSELKQGQLPG